MITATDLELRAGARILLEPTTLRVQPGDRIGLVGRNGAGKTTSLRVLAGETLPHAGRHRAPTARSATCRRIRAPATSTSSPATACCRPAASTRPRHRHRQGADPAGRDARRRGAGPPLRQPRGALLRARRVRRRERGGPDLREPRPARPRAGPAAAARCPVASAAASSWPASCSPTPAGEPTTLLLDEPTNHLDADSITWLRDFLRQHTGGLIVISHDVELLDAVVNKVWYLDANRTDRRRLQRRLEDLPAAARDRRAAPAPRAGQRRAQDRVSCEAQADKMRAKATKARAAQQMDCAAPPRSPPGWPRCGSTTRSPGCASRRRRRAARTPLTAEGLSKSYGSLEVFTDVDLAVDRGARVVVLGLNGAGKTTLLRLLAGIEPPDTGDGRPRARPAAGLLRPGARDPRPRPDRSWRTCARPRRPSAAPT